MLSDLNIPTPQLSNASYRVLLSSIAIDECPFTDHHCFANFVFASSLLGRRVTWSAGEDVSGRAGRWGKNGPDIEKLQTVFRNTTKSRGDRPNVASVYAVCRAHRSFGHERQSVRVLVTFRDRVGANSVDPCQPIAGL
ncbi:hypothetical protein K435DRAFT_792792 [Dendrothele bispora CBS 962.96]|uniref:Uncharacterized protein n=1 Tax=Dendrothele bispora (strain CBS 962.96) TaxID=1314807 RepID=A0A4S8MIU2_DENBC|nr:hypothetical protein K435DRAFT_792792 [Dendrothele bispora CBS 962.96]